MNLLRYTRLFLAVLVGFAIVAPGLVGAQEETTVSAQDEVLSRFDTPAVSERAREARENKARREQLESEIEALEEEGEFGPPRQALREELYSMPSPDDEADQLASARLRAVAAAPVEGTDEEKAAALRRKAETAYAVDSALDDVRLKAEHDNYVLFGDSPAVKAAKKYEIEASALEAVPEETVEETSENTTAAAPPGDAGGAGEDPEANSASEPDEPGVSDGSLAGNTGGFGITSLLAAALIVLGVGYYLIGLFRNGLGARVKRVGAPQQAHAPKPKSPTASRKESHEAPVDSPGTVTRATEESRGSGSRAASPGTSQGRVTPSTERETGSLDDESLAAWFAQEMGEKEESRSERRRKRRGEREAPEDVPEVPQKDVNQLVAEEVARMRADGELSEDDEVEVRVEGGKIVVRRKE